MVGFAGWQTADLNVHKKTRRRLAKGMELQRRVLEFWKVWGTFGGVLRAGKRDLNIHKKKRPRLAACMQACASCASCGLATADLNVHKKTRPRLATGMELQRKVLEF